MKKGGFFKRTMNDVPLAGQTVLVRADYNVPLAEDGSISDDFRIVSSLPTLKRLLEENCKVVIISHLGRPEGVDKKLSLEQIAERLGNLLGQEVMFVDATVGDKVKMAIKQAPQKSVVLLENLRFDPREEANDSHFAQQLAESSTARFFIQDGFGVVHRAHASTAAITQFLPSVAGLLLEHEYTAITHAMNEPDRPLVAVMGGAKVSDKIGVIEAFVERADRLIITGAMANTFLAEKGIAVGKSKHETDQGETIERIYTAAAKKVGKQNVDEFIILPRDVAVGENLSANEPRRDVALNAVADDEYILDIGKESIEQMVSHVSLAKTVVWNGTVGMAEYPEFAHGSARLALALATQPGITSIIGGGDTADFVLKWDARKGESFTHVSTGGGASLELMAGKKLPGVESLLDA